MRLLLKNAMRLFGMFEFAFSLVLLPAFCSLLLLWVSVLVTVAVSLWVADVVFKRMVARVQCFPPASRAADASR